MVGGGEWGRTVPTHRHYKAWILLVQATVHLKTLLDIFGKTDHRNKSEALLCVILILSLLHDGIRFHFVDIFQIEKLWFHQNLKQHQKRHQTNDSKENFQK